MVYAANVEPLYDAAVFAAWYRAVSEDRRQKIDRLHAQAAKCRSLGAAALLQKALAENGITEVVTACDAYGKPYLPQHPDVYVNLSHSGAYVLCAVETTPVGCDIQQITGDVDLRVAARCFTPDERAWTEAEPTKQRERFFRLWAIKESVVKAVGKGLRMPLSSFAVTFGDRITVSCDEALYVREYDEIDGYCCAVCRYAEHGGAWRELSLR